MIIMKYFNLPLAWIENGQQETQALFKRFSSLVSVSHTKIAHSTGALLVRREDFPALLVDRACFDLESWWLLLEAELPVVFRDLLRLVDVALRPLLPSERCDPVFREWPLLRPSERCDRWLVLLRTESPSVVPFRGLRRSLRCALIFRISLCCSIMWFRRFARFSFPAAQNKTKQNLVRI